MFLCETKNPDEVVRQKCDQLRYEDHHLVTPTGQRVGGLALFWNQPLKLSVLSSNADVIDTMIEHEGNSFYGSFVNASTNKTKQNQLWDSLLVTAETRYEPWFVTADFNDILNSEEKTGGTDRSEGSFSDLRTFFSEGDLYDLHHKGDPLSWRGQRGTHLVRCRLDRAVANSSWAENYRHDANILSMKDQIINH